METKKIVIITNLQSLVKIPVIIVDSDESVPSPAEGDLVGVVVPPVVECGVTGRVPEAHHGVDLAPAVLADPTVTAGAVLVEKRELLLDRRHDQMKILERRIVKKKISLMATI